MIWLYNLRISYPHAEIYIADDDISGAFRLCKYHPNMMSMHSSRYDLPGDCDRPFLELYRDPDEAFNAYTEPACLVDVMQRLVSSARDGFLSRAPHNRNP